MNPRLLNFALRVTLALVFTLCLVGIPASRAAADTTFVVNSDGDAEDASKGNGVCATAGGVCTLRAAIQEANAWAGSDTITFSSSPIITLTSGLPATTGTLAIDGSGQNVTISGNHLYIIMTVGYGASLTLNQLTIIDGLVTGIYNHGALTVTNSTFTGNSGNLSAGIFSSGTALTVTNSSFSANSTTYFGGAIGTQSGVTTISNSTFSANSAPWGGAIFSSGTSLTVADSTFNGNAATSSGGGAIYSSSGSLTVSNSTFMGNSAVQKGGAIYKQYNTLTVTGSTFVSNNAGEEGGAIFNQEGTVVIANSTFSGNTATFHGGAVYGCYSASSMTLINSTFSGNGAPNGGGAIHNWDGALNLINTILANSASGVDCYSNVAITPPINTLMETNTSCGTPLTSADPILGPLADNGGPTQTFALLADSPAIDAGDDATCIAPPINNLDQRGTLRSYGAHCDIGSYEQKKGRLVIRSSGAQDGWILESGEATNLGGTMDSTATTLRVGDDTARKQYRSILSFSTGNPLPDNAVITRVRLKVKQQGIVGGGNPVTAFQGFMLDIKKGIFGSTAALQLPDWQAAVSKTVGPFTPGLASGWYVMDITPAKGTINKLATGSGLTQIRLRFKLDDNNNTTANVLNLYSGNYATVTARPTLIVDYYIP